MDRHYTVPQTTKLCKISQKPLKYLKKNLGKSYEVFMTKNEENLQHVSKIGPLDCSTEDGTTFQMVEATTSNAQLSKICCSLLQYPQINYREKCLL